MIANGLVAVRADRLMSRSGLGLADAGHEPGHDLPPAITTASDVMFCFQSEGGGLLFSLPLLAWKRHPFTNDCSARLVFRFHDRSLFSQFLCGSMHPAKLRRHRLQLASICIKAALAFSEYKVAHMNSRRDLDHIYKF